MARLTCPFCNRKSKVPQYVLEATLRCPGCSEVFRAKVWDLAPPVRPVPVESPAPQLRLAPLVIPCHQCQHCAAPITSPVDRPAATVDCPSCGNKTSVYAILHACPSCGRLLESPSRAAGMEVSCPACARLLRVPKDVLRKEPPAHPDDFWFGFYCPNCSEEVVTRATDVGTYAVCPHCRMPLVIPHAGHYLEGGGGRPPPAPDPLDCLHASKEVTCPKCQARAPARATVCPRCGAPMPSASPWGRS